MEIPPLVAIQLCQIYGIGLSRLSVYRSNVQQQPSGTLDCGVFAVANIVEFGINGYSELEKSMRSWNFDVPKMRTHLVQCLKNENFTPFLRKQVKQIFMDYDREFINISCKGECSLPDIYCNMAKCDRCVMWFHEICGGRAMDKNWFCKKCSKNVSNDTRTSKKRLVKAPNKLNL